MDWYIVDKKYINYLTQFDSVPDQCLTQLKYNQIETFRAFSSEKEKTDYIYLLQKEKFLIDDIQNTLQNKAFKLYKKCITKLSHNMVMSVCSTITS